MVGEEGSAVVGPVVVRLVLEEVDPRGLVPGNEVVADLVVAAVVVAYGEVEGGIGVGYAVRTWDVPVEDLVLDGGVVGVVLRSAAAAVLEEGHVFVPDTGLGIFKK